MVSPISPLQQSPDEARYQTVIGEAQGEETPGVLRQAQDGERSRTISPRELHDIPVDHLVGHPQFAELLLRKKYKNIVVVAPDIGAVKRGRKMASLLNVPLVIVDKRRPEHNKAEFLCLIGDVKGKTAVILDDIVDTAGTICRLASILKDKGAKDVIVCVTHALLSGNAPENLKNCAASKILICDTVDIDREKKIDKIEVISLASLLAKVRKRIHHGNRWESYLLGKKRK